jgi:hypothetical protein
VIRTLTVTASSYGIFGRTRPLPPIVCTHLKEVVNPQQSLTLFWMAGGCGRLHRGLERHRGHVLRGDYGRHHRGTTPLEVFLMMMMMMMIMMMMMKMMMMMIFNRRT